MISRNRHRVGLLVALMIASCGISPAIAQQGENAPTRCDVDFPGGTLSEYVDAVRKACSDAANSIVVAPKALDLPVPPVKLVGITAVPAMQILEGHYYTTDNGREARVKVRTYRGGVSSGGKRSLAMKVDASITSGNVRSAVWSVEEALIYGQTAEKLLAAVEAALSLFPRKAEISYHPPTGLLIARGEKEQLDLVGHLLFEFNSGAKQRHQDYESLRARIDQHEVERVRVTAQIHIAQKKIEVGRVVSEALAKSNGPAGAMASKVAAEDLGVAKAEADRMQLQQEGQRLLQKIAELREALKRYETDQE